jgi:signal transduction histidine kinase
LNRVIYEVVTLTRPIWSANDAIAVKIDGAVPAIALADPADVREVLVNLVLNAVAAMPQGGEITFTCHANEREVMLEVADTGVGIAPEDLEAIFEPGRTSRPSGMGLGLPTSRSLIEQAGGRLTVESEPGCGATFTIVLPRAAQIERAGGMSTRAGQEAQARRGSGQHP